MDYGANYVDISRWMLFEASGDSEFDSDICCTVSFNGDVGRLSSSTSSAEVERGSLAEGDAFSCSCDDNNYCSRDFDDSYVCFGDGKDAEEDHGQAKLRDGIDPYDRRGQEGEGEDEDEDEDAVDQVRKGAGGVNNVFNSCEAEQPPEAVEVMMKNMRELAEAGRQKKPKACGKPVELISQKDTDRLFWEACLSS